LKQILARSGLIASEATASGVSAMSEEWGAELDRFLQRYDLT
jgi:hypothetical protein